MRNLFKSRALWILLLLTAVLVYRVLPPVSNRLVLGNPNADITNQFLCPYHFAGQALRSGSFPLWNPHILSGTPFLATLQTGLLYPLAMPFYLLLPAVAAVNLIIALHIFLAGAFMYHFLRGHKLTEPAALAGALVYAFAATTVLRVHAGHLSILMALPWAPFLFRRLERLHMHGSFINTASLAFGLTMMFLAGQPQFVFYTGLALVCYLGCLIWQERYTLQAPAWRGALVKILLLAAAAGLSLLLAAAQFLPTLEMTRLSTRQAASLEWAASFAMPVENLLTLLIPGFFGSSAGSLPYWGKNLIWETCVYAGIVPLLLCLFAFRGRESRRRAWFWLGLGLGALLLSLGSRTPLFAICYRLLPGFSMFRGVGKAMFLFTFALSVLTASGTENLLQNGCGLRRKRLLFSSAIALFLVLSAAVLLSRFLHQEWFARQISGILASPDFVMQAIAEELRTPQFAAAAKAWFSFSLSRSILFLGLGLGLLNLTAFFDYGRRVRIAAAILIPALIALDLLSFGLRYTAAFDSHELLWDRQVLDFLAHEQQPYRVAAPQFRLNTNLIAGVDSPEGAETMLLRDYNRYYNYSQMQPVDEPSHYVRTWRFNRLTDLLNLKYLLADAAAPVQAPELEPVMSGNSQALYRNRNAFPRAFTVHAAEFIADSDKALERLLEPDFDPAATVILTTPTAAVTGEHALTEHGSAGHPCSAAFTRYSAERQELRVELESPGFLVISQNHYPGWQAAVNGRGAKLLPANIFMQALPLPAGSHRVELFFRSDSFRTGAWISAVSLLLCVFAAILEYRRRQIKTG